MRVSRHNQRGQVAVVFSWGIVAFLAATALAVDVAVMYANWEILQKAVDAGALAGASYLPNDPSTARKPSRSMSSRRLPPVRSSPVSPEGVT